MPTGHDAPWRGRRITRTSWQKYLPPNWAPMPKLAGQLEDLGLQLEVAARVAELVAGGGQAVVGSGSLASLAVSTAYSAEVPPMTTPRWYGGQAAVPILRQLLRR